MAFNVGSWLQAARLQSNYYYAPNCNEQPMGSSKWFERAKASKVVDEENGVFFKNLHVDGFPGGNRNQRGASRELGRQSGAWAIT